MVPFVIAAIFVTISVVFAAVTLTPATGGSAISADTTGGTYTALTGPVIAENAGNDMNTGTIILNAPTGFVFDTGGIAPTVLVTCTASCANSANNFNDLPSGSTIATTRTASTITVTITASTQGQTRNSLTWQDVRVRPSAGAPLASGNITKSGTLSISGVTNDVTNLGTLTEVPGAKNKLAFTTQPSATASINTDFATKPVIAVQDQFGNTVTSDNTSTVTRTAVLSTQVCGGTAGTGTLTSTPADNAAVTAGVLTYTAMQYSVGEAIRICAASTGVTSALSDAVSVQNPVPTITSISPTSTFSGSSDFTLTVNGTNFVSASTVAWNGSSLTTTYVSGSQLTAIVPAANIVTPGTFSITVVNPAPGGGTSNTMTFTVLVGATKFVILNPADGTVDNPITITVQAQNASSEVFTSYQSDVTLAVSGSATGGGLVDIVNGVGTMNISDTVAETVTLSLQDTESTGLDASSVQDVVFGVGALAQFSLDAPADIVAGNRAAYAVTHKDQYGNLRTTGTTTVYLYTSSNGANARFYDAASGGNSITNATISSGQSTASFWYYDEKPGSWTITASDNASAPDGVTGVNDAMDTLVVTAGPVAQYEVDNPGNMTAGTLLGYAVSRKDQFGNAVSSGASTIYLYSNSTGPAAFYATVSTGTPAITSVDIPDGSLSQNFWYTDDAVGTWTITASDNASAPDGASGIIDGTDQVTVNMAPIVATRFRIVNPTDGTVDASIAVTIRVEDGSSNLDTSYQSDVTLVVSGSATGGGLVDIVNGVGTMNISDTVAETVALSLQDTESTGLDVSSVQDVVFGVGAVQRFAISDPGDAAAGVRLQYTVTRKDQFGNLVTAGATAVYLYNSSNGANARFYDAASGGSSITSIAIPDGQSSVSVWYYDEKAGSWIVTASDNASAPDDASGILDAADAVAVQPGGVYQFSLDDPGNMTAGTRLGYTVTRKDQYDNLVTSGVTLGYLYSSSVATTTKFYDAAVGGFPITVIPINDGQSSENFWYYEETVGTWQVTVSDGTPTPNGTTGVQDAIDSVSVSAAPIVATQFSFIVQTSAQVNTPVTVTVRAVDDSGNIDTTFQTDVTLVVSGSATGGGLVDIVNGVGTKTISDASAELVLLSLDDTQSSGLDASATTSILFSTQPVIEPTGVGGGAFYAPLRGAEFSGIAFRAATIRALALADRPTPISQEVTASRTGSFSLSFANPVIGARSYMLVATDPEGRRAQTKIYDTNLTGIDNYLSVEDVFFSPTIDVVYDTIFKGDFLKLEGYGVPQYRIEMEIDGKIIPRETRVGADGIFRISYNTASLSAGSHTIRVRQASASGRKSEFSTQRVFVISSVVVPQTDFNGDGVINVGDWGIFLARWQSTNPKTRLLDDLNGDGKVDAIDFSIFVNTLKQ